MKMRRIILLLALIFVCQPKLALGVVGNAPAYNAGDLDTSFGDNGRFVYPGSVCPAIAIQKNDKIVVIASDSEKEFKVLRLCADGKKLDDGVSCGAGAFGQAGVVITSLGKYSGVGLYRGPVSALEIAPDGKIVAAGTVSVPYTAESSHIALFRYNADGSSDNAFDADGQLYARFGEHFSENDMLLQGDGKIVLATGVNDDVGVIRINVDGTLDKTFGGGDGIVTAKLWYADSRIAQQADGKILLAGSNEGIADFEVIRLLQDGNIDSKGFGVNGTVRTDFSVNNYLGTPRDIAVQKDGRILAGGSALTPLSDFDDFVMASYCESGKMNDGINCGQDGFADGGKLEIDFGIADMLTHFALQGDGKIVAIGTMGTGNGDVTIVRINPDGSFDRDFGHSGKVIDRFKYTTQWVVTTDVAIQSDGKIITSSVGDDCVISRYYGSTDTDGDGVQDQFDKCPATEKGIEVNKSGCPRTPGYMQIRKPDFFLNFFRRFRF